MFLFPRLSISHFLSVEMCTRYRVSREVIDEPKSAVAPTEPEALSTMCELVLVVEGHRVFGKALQVATEKHELLRAKHAWE